MEAVFYGVFTLKRDFAALGAESPPHIVEHNTLYQLAIKHRLYLSTLC